MSKSARLVILAVVLVAAALTIYFRGTSGNSPATTEGVTDISASQTETVALPKLVDLGSTTCIPCKKMEPILASLSENYEGRLDVEFININEDRDAASQYGIRLIPTQIFFDAEGRELFRHEGYISQDDILAKWNELGVALDASPQS